MSLAKRALRASLDAGSDGSVTLASLSGASALRTLDLMFEAAPSGGFQYRLSGQSASAAEGGPSAPPERAIPLDTLDLMFEADGGAFTYRPPPARANAERGSEPRTLDRLLTPARCSASSASSSGSGCTGSGRTSRASGSSDTPPRLSGGAGVRGSGARAARQRGTGLPQVGETSMVRVARSE